MIYMITKNDLEFIDVEPLNSRIALRIKEAISYESKVRLCKYNGGIYVYKEDKGKDSIKAYSSVSEYLAKLICDQLGIKAADVVLGEGFCLSKVMHDGEIYYFDEARYNMTKSGDILFTDADKAFSVRRLLDNRYVYKDEFVDMLLFDILIGNIDRHLRNFAFTDVGFYPLFDNEMSLMNMLREDSIDEMASDNEKLQKFQFSTESRICIAGRDSRDKNGSRESGISHIKLLWQLKVLEGQRVRNFSERVKNVDIDDEINNMPISENRKKVIKGTIHERKQWFDRV